VVVASPRGLMFIALHTVDWIFRHSTFPSDFHTSAGGHLRLPPLRQQVVRNVRMLIFPKLIRVQRQESCHNAQTGRAPSFYLKKHAMIENSGRNNSAYYFERINTFHSHFERDRSHYIRV
jgi:hypothetical protein